MADAAGDLRQCAYCVHGERVHGLEQAVLICRHRPGYRGLWISVEREGTYVRFKRGGAVPTAAAGVRAVPLSQGKFALVDRGDYAGVIRYSWYAAKTPSRFADSPFERGRSSGDKPLRGTGPLQGESCVWYAVRKDKGRTIRMHREIMRPGRGQVVDHINHDGLDNRRCNLRVCSHAENLRNQRGQVGRSSRFKGVSRDKRLGKWRAQIWHAGRHYYLGLYVSEIEAARAYDAKARELFGEFAYLNGI